MLQARGEDAESAVDVGRHRVLQSFAQAPRGFEDGQLVRRRVAGNVLEEIGALIRFVMADNDEVEVAIAIGVARDGRGPEADAEIHDEAGIVVAERGQFGCLDQMRNQDGGDEDGEKPAHAIGAEISTAPRTTRRRRTARRHSPEKGWRGRRRVHGRDCRSRGPRPWG